MNGFDVSFPVAAGAGLLSFASPCVLPLVPAYLCFLGGVSLDELTADGRPAKQGRVMAAALAFVLGFSLVFIAMGASATVLNRLLLDNMDWLAVAAGTVIIILGLHYMGAFRLGFLNVEKRFHLQAKPAGLLGAFVIGLAFAFGWTPCVGPILATILMVAAGSDSVWYGTALLGTYAAGMGLPFLLAAFAAKPFMAWMARFKRHMRKVELAIGGLLVVTGVLILTGSIAEISNFLLEVLPQSGRIG